MKNMTKIIAFALVAVMCVAMLASCGGPNSDPAKAEAALKENGYTVISMPVGDYANYKNLETVLIASKGLLTDDAIAIYYFADSASATDAFEDIEKDEAEDNKDNENFVCKKSGKLIYAGHKNAVKAAK